MHFSGAKVAGVDRHDGLAGVTGCLFGDAGSLAGQTQVEQSSAALNEFAHTVLLASGDDIVLRLLLLQHQPLHLNIVAGVAPVAQGTEVAEVKLLLESSLYAGKTPGNLARHKRRVARRS